MRFSRPSLTEGLRILNPEPRRATMELDIMTHDIDAEPKKEILISRSYFHRSDKIIGANKAGGRPASFVYQLPWATTHSAVSFSPTGHGVWWRVLVHVGYRGFRGC